MRCRNSKLQAVVHAIEIGKQLAIDLKQALWSKFATEEGRVLAIAAKIVVQQELRRSTHWTPSFLPNITGLLDVNGCIPHNFKTQELSHLCLAKLLRLQLVLTSLPLHLVDPSSRLGGGLEFSKGVTKEVVFTLNRGTPQEGRCSLKATVVDTIAYCAVLGMDFVTRVGGVIDT